VGRDCPTVSSFIYVFFFPIFYFFLLFFIYGFLVLRHFPLLGFAGFGP